ncbi:CbiX/SirB N-terminal domain-containing protein [Salinifilum aidingensis]
MNRPRPLLLVGHGTVDEGGVGEFRAFTQRVAERVSAAGIDVGGGFIELSAPAVNEAWDDLAERGHAEMVAVPLVLVAAGHGKGDIPAALEREVKRNPATRYVFGRPLGPHPTLLSVLSERVEAEVPRSEWTDTAVVLVGRGSTDPDANSEVSKVSRLLQETGGFATVETSFISLAPPDVPGGLERARRLGAKRVVVAPYFLFDGVLPQRVVTQAHEYGERNPDIDVRVAGYLGNTDALADLVVERYHEALHGDIRMNCDTCAYRVLLPGFEDKLGQPQTPHHHPDDPTGQGHGHGHAHGHAH